MDDPRPLEGMARSIDALFSEAERRLAPEPPASGDGGPVGDERPADAVGPESAPLGGDLDFAWEEQGAEAVDVEPSGASADALERARRDVDAIVGSADLLDDIEVFPPRSDWTDLPSPLPVPIDADADEDEDPEALAAAAAWTDSDPEAPDASADDAEPTAAPALEDEAVLAEEEGTTFEEGPILEEGSTFEEGSIAEEAPTFEEGADEVPPLMERWREAPVDPALAPGSGADAGEARRPAPHTDVALRARALAAAVERYLDAEPRRKEAAADAVRDAAAAHRGAGELDAPADAVERLALGDDPGAADLARELTIPSVASRLVVRLGMAREEERRAELLRIAESLGAAMAPAIADALSGAEDRSARRNYVEALVHLGDPGLQVAEGMVADERWFVVRNGVAILGEIGGDRAVAHLTSTLGHADPRVRREALMALAHIGGDDAGMLVAGKLEDPEPEVRGSAAMAVGVLRVERAQRPLQALLETEHDEDALVEVLRALGRLGDPGAVPGIEKKAVGSFFSRPPTAVRMAAYRALAAIGTPHAKRVLEDAADDREPEVRHLARGLLQGR